VSGWPDPVPRLHVLVSEREVASAVALATVRTLLRDSRSIAIHLRARVPTRELYGLARELAGLAEAGSWCVVNGRPDVALAASAQAVQLGHAALGVAVVRRLAPCGGDLRIGASVHRPDEALEAVTDGADYLVVGTVFDTPAHPGAAAGPALIRTVSEALAGRGSGRPILAIGGVTADRVAELARAGAHGVVVGRAVWGSTRPVRSARELVEAWAEQGEGDE